MDILVVEDNVAVASFLVQSIKKWGFVVETSNNGKSALKRLQEKAFDLVLLDLFLPDIQGDALIPEFKQLWPQIGIITITGRNSRELESRVRQQGILYYFIKPFKLKILKEILDHVSERVNR